MRLINALIGALLVYMHVVTPASAHALRVKAEPARRVVLAKAPKAVRLWFNERLEPKFSSMSVTGNKGAVSTTLAVVSASDPKLLELALPALEPGEYTVKYKVLSFDGHSVSATYRFSVKAP